MKKTAIVAVVCALEVAFITAALANKNTARVAAALQVRQFAPAPDRCWRSVVCRRDLFDRNNPNNLRSDWPGPPAQPGQF